MLRHDHQSLRQGLISAWCPSLGAGRVLTDRSGRNANATVGVGAAFDPRNSGLALMSSTTDLALYAAQSTFVGQSVATVSYWWTAGVNTDAIGVCQGVSETSRVFFGAGGGSNPAGLIYVGGRYPSGDFYGYGNVSLLVNKPRHFAGLIDTRQSTAATCRRAWVDGIEISLTQIGGVSPAFPTSSSGVLVGSAYYGATSFSASTIGLDDIRIYNRALTQAEIRLLASQRGIGLVPRPVRRAALPRKAYVNVGGTWRDADTYLNVGGSWKLSTPFINVGGTWK